MGNTLSHWYYLSSRKLLVWLITNQCSWNISLLSDKCQAFCTRVHFYAKSYANYLAFCKICLKCPAYFEHIASLRRYEHKESTAHISPLTLYRWHDSLRHLILWLTAGCFPTAGLHGNPCHNMTARFLLVRQQGAHDVVIFAGGGAAWGSLEGERNAGCLDKEIKYRKISNIGRTKSQNLKYSRLVLQLPLPNPLKPGVKSRMKMWLEQCRQAMLQLHLSDRVFYCLLMFVLY